MRADVTICMPIYRGEAYLEETIETIRAQTHPHFKAVMSIDGEDPACEAICERVAAADSRFGYSVRAERLGWVGNFNWTFDRADTEFCYYHQQDDLIAPDYIGKLIGRLRSHPEAVLAYSNVVPKGRISGSFDPVPSVVGATPYDRMLTMLHGHYVAFAMRGLVRIDALRRAGPLPTNRVDHFGVDICWLLALAREGELHQVPEDLYWKRYHDRNTESKWWEWPLERKFEAWPQHCADMVNIALGVRGSVEDMRLLWLAGVKRVTSISLSWPFFRLDHFEAAQREAMLGQFFDDVRAGEMHDIPMLLDADWSTIERWSRDLLETSREQMLSIRSFGPRSVEAGVPFHPQPDGASAIWLKTDRRIPPGARIQLGGEVLQTVLDRNVATASVPPELTARAGAVPLMLVDSHGRPHSDRVELRVEGSAG